MFLWCTQSCVEASVARLQPDDQSRMYLKSTETRPSFAVLLPWDLSSAAITYTECLHLKCPCVGCSKLFRDRRNQGHIAAKGGNETCSSLRRRKPSVDATPPIAGGHFTLYTQISGAYTYVPHCMSYSSSHTLVRPLLASNFVLGSPLRLS